MPIYSSGSMWDVFVSHASEDKESVARPIAMALEANGLRTWLDAQELNVGDSLRLDYINQTGPTDAWVTLDTVTLTNTSQLYFDVSVLGQPGRLYRIVPAP